MQESQSHVAQLVRWDTKKNSGTSVHTLSCHFDQKHERIGKVYGILSIDTQPKIGEALAAHIEDVIQRSVAEMERTLPNEISQEQIFESVIAKVNQAIQRLKGDGGLSFDSTTVNAALIATKGSEVVATIWGKPTMLLFHPLPNAAIRMFDLIQEKRVEPVTNPFYNAIVPSFSTLIAGRVGKKDRLLLSTQDIRQFLPIEELESLLLSNEPYLATEILREKFSSMNDKKAIALLVLDAADVHYKEQREETITQHDVPKPQQNLSITELPPQQKQGPSLISKLYTYTVQTIKQLAKIGHFLFLLLTKQEKRQEFFSRFRESHDHSLENLTQRFNTFSILQRILFFGVMILIVILNTSIAVSAQYHKQQIVITNHEKTISLLEQKIDSAEASIIYHDEERAKQLLSEASVGINALPEKNTADKNLKTVLKKKIAEKYIALRHVITLGPPEILTSITTGKETPILTKIAMGTGVLWSVSTKGELFTTNISTGATEKIGDIPNHENPKIFLTDGQNLIAASETGTVLKIQQNNKISQEKIDFNDTNPTINDAALYNARLYILDATHNRILRHVAGETQFGKPQFYLKDGTDVSNALSLTIDGSVYVLKKDGVIIKIIKGEQENFSVAKVEPPMTAPKKIKTAAEFDSLYVLDGVPHRILRFSKKTGALTGQFMSDKLSEATDFFVDEKAHIAFIPLKNQILKFTLLEQ